jgi:hypothetical protein
MLALNAGLGPVMDDGFTLFHASHGNIGTGAALSQDSVEADRVLMVQQKEPGGQDFLALQPAVLLVPAGLRAKAIEINGVQIVTNYELERIQMLFPGKPDAETIGMLKGAGWNWSPRNTAWQRMITPATMRSAQKIAAA